MRGVCARAGLTSRYFYDNFDDTESLLLAVRQEVRHEITAQLVSAITPHLSDTPEVQLEALLQTIVEWIEEDPGAVQIFFGDHGGSDALESLRRETIDAVANLLIDFARPRFHAGTSEDHFRVAALMGIGGFIEAVTAWRSGAVSLSREPLVQVILTAALGMAQGYVRMDRL